MTVLHLDFRFVFRAGEGTVSQSLAMASWRTLDNGERYTLRTLSISVCILKVQMKNSHNGTLFCCPRMEVARTSLGVLCNKCSAQLSAPRVRRTSRGIWRYRRDKLLVQ